MIAHAATGTLEAANPLELGRKGWTRSTLKAGDQMTANGYWAKSEPMTVAARMIELLGRWKLSVADDHYFKSSGLYFCASCPIIPEFERLERNRVWVAKEQLSEPGLTREQICDQSQEATS
jgi:hypothetical protein